jgi:hypothetical protein
MCSLTALLSPLYLDSYEQLWTECLCSPKIHVLSQALVAHACNPSYLQGRDQEDRSLRPSRQQKLDPISRIQTHKRADRVVVKW